MSGNFIVKQDLLKKASDELTCSMDLISILKKNIEDVKKFPLEYEYKLDVNEIISELTKLFKNINETYVKLSNFMPINIKKFDFFLKNNYLGIVMDIKSALPILTDYFNYLEQKSDLTSEEKKTYSSLYDYLKYKDINKFLSSADNVNQNLRNRGVTYSTETGIYNDADKSFNSDKTCCATYVTNVLYDYDSNTYSKERLSKFNYNYCQTLYNELKKDMKEINSIEDIKAGDIVFMSSVSGSKNDIQHVQIYAGDNCWYNAGSTDAIYRGRYEDTSQNYRFITALRPYYKNNDEFEDNYE